MKIIVSDIASALVELGIPFEAQSRYLQAAVAKVIGYSLPIPAEAAADVSTYFDETLAATVAGALDSLNERVPVDYVQTTALIRQVWGVRYGIVHPQNSAQAWAVLDACVKKAHICDDVDFADASIQRLAAILAGGLER